ncbi:hypothetical protein HGB07_09390 [Candidatus Roizmanbacteria bacterium]|jgi:hypothetical protein|nr:hypothetical protein [Candidatus Roizmanbacteria bacterium]
MIDKILNSMSELVTAQGKVLGKAIDAQATLIDSVNKNATGVLDTFTKKVNEALGNVKVTIGATK